MRKVNVVGIVFPNQHDACLGELTSVRSLGSVPFGGRYRLIDFVLSNMVNAGIGKVGLATKSNYQSLMDHLGTGKPWDLDRKNGGLYFLPTHVSNKAYSGRMAALSEMRVFLEHCKEDYVLMSDCHVVGNLDYEPLIQQHIDTGADITVAYRVGAPVADTDNLSVKTDKDGKIVDIRVNPAADTQNAAYGIGLYVVRRERLMELMEDCAARVQDDFERDVLMRRLGELAVYGYEVTEYLLPIHSIATYFEANMALLDGDIRGKIFPADRKIYTKVRDCAPATYGLHAAVSDSLVADGAVIEGTVRHSVVFRDVTVGSGVVLDHCIIMQGAEIHTDAALGYVICDKDVQVQKAGELQGVSHYPVYVKKGMKI